MGLLVVERLFSRLLGGMSNASNSEEVKRECLDNMTDLIKRFGQLSNEQSHGDCLASLLMLLRDDKPIIRKKAALCMVQ